MQTLECHIGPWRARGRIQPADDGKLLAVVSAIDSRGGKSAESRHTIVFEGRPGQDGAEQTRRLLERILLERYGSSNFGDKAADDAQ